jgi:hypothetical protein
LGAAKPAPRVKRKQSFNNNDTDDDDDDDDARYCSCNQMDIAQLQSDLLLDWKATQQANSDETKYKYKK